MIQSYLVWSTLALSLSKSLGFSTNHMLFEHSSSVQQFATNYQDDEMERTFAVSRKQWVSQFVAAVSATIVGTTTAANAEESEGVSQAAPSTPQYSIQKCSVSSKAPCVSTANVRQLDLYMAPWTFSKPVDEVMSRLKGAIVTDTNCEVVKQEGNQYLLVEAKRGDLFSTIDQLEFAINENDQVVTFSSAATNNDNRDFGLNKKRLEEIRKRAGIFGVMGDSMKSADSVSIGERGNGPLGQLKAFYGLQSGGGFEDVLSE